VVELEGFVKSSGGFGSPATVPLVKAIAGDTSDDIDGVPNIADKRALGLLSRYQTIEGLLAASLEFMEFSKEPTYAHALMNPEMHALIRRNLALVSLAQGPTLQGADCELIVGEANELDLYELFVDLEFVQWQENFGAWQRFGSQRLDLGVVQAVQRAVANLAQSWGR
jgi:5'-3' exonuclease